MANISPADVNAPEAATGPPVPDVLTELLREFTVSDPNLDHIAKLIAVEPTLAEEVVRRSNRVMFAGSAPAMDVFEAITRIGILEARSAVLSLSHQSRPASVSHRL